MDLPYIFDDINEGYNADIAKCKCKIPSSNKKQCNLKCCKENCNEKNKIK